MSPSSISSDKCGRRIAADPILQGVGTVRVKHGDDSIISMIDEMTPVAPGIEGHPDVIDITSLIRILIYNIIYINYIRWFIT